MKRRQRKNYKKKSKPAPTNAYTPQTNEYPPRIQKPLGSIRSVGCRLPFGLLVHIQANGFLISGPNGSVRPAKSERGKMKEAKKAKHNAGLQSLPMFYVLLCAGQSVTGANVVCGLDFPQAVDVYCMAANELCQALLQNNQTWLPLDSPLNHPKQGSPSFGNTSWTRGRVSSIMHEPLPPGGGRGSGACLLLGPFQ